MLLEVLVAITLAFVGWLVIKNIVSKKLCAVCLAVSTTWIGLFVLMKIGVFTDAVLLAILMGQSIVGLYYVAEKRAPKPLLIFRLPFLLTLTYIFYSVITGHFLLAAGIYVTALWLIFGVLFSLKTKPRVKQAVKKLIECCGNW